MARSVHVAVTELTSGGRSDPARASRIQACLARTAAAVRARGGAAWGGAPARAAPATLEEEVQGEMLGRLAPGDRGSLETVAAHREEALRLARSGRLDEATTSLRVSRFVLSLSSFSPTGRIVAETLHEAAESYLAYRRGAYDQALARMRASIDATLRLEAAWQEPGAMAGRWVHLTHNLMRVEARRGAHEEAIAVGARLLGYLAGAPAAMTAGSDPPRRAPLDPILVDFFLIAVMDTVAEVLASLPADRASALLPPLRRAHDSAGPAQHPAWRWLAVRAAFLDGDPELFLSRAEPLLLARDAMSPTLWYAVLADLVRIAGQYGADDLVSEVREELTRGTGMLRSGPPPARTSASRVRPASLPVGA